MNSDKKKGRYGKMLQINIKAVSRALQEALTSMQNYLLYANTLWNKIVTRKSKRSNFYEM